MCSLQSYKNFTFCCWPSILIMFVMWTNVMHYLPFIYCATQPLQVSGIRCASSGGSGFSGLVVSMLASGTQDRSFEPGRSHRIFQAKKIHSMPSFGEVKPYVPCCRFAARKGTLWFTWESETRAKLTGHFSPVILSFTNRGLSWRGVPMEMMGGTKGGRLGVAVTGLPPCRT
jgi:hypothetical protein